MNPLRKVAYYGGSFDPPHRGHLAIASAVLERFRVDEFVFVPAFHAPHKTRLKPTSAYDRYAMLCLATNAEPTMQVSRIEIELPERPYSIETIERLKETDPEQEIFFVMGADSWMDILTWRRWEELLLAVNHIIITRPGHEIDDAHVSPVVRERIVDLRGGKRHRQTADRAIYFSDAVQVPISATGIRSAIRSGSPWRSDVPDAVAKYIEKYQIYT